MWSDKEIVKERDITITQSKLCFFALKINPILSLKYEYKTDYENMHK